MNNAYLETVQPRHNTVVSELQKGRQREPTSKEQDSSVNRVRFGTKAQYQIDSPDRSRGYAKPVRTDAGDRRNKGAKPPSSEDDREHKKNADKECTHTGGTSATKGLDQM